MGKYPITQAQWRTVAMSPKVAIDLNLTPSFHRGEDKPVEQVTWYQAQEFCARLSRLTGENYRLPSEAEWEYACRAGAEDYTEYYFGDDASQLDNYGWYGNNSGDRAIDADGIWKEVNQNASQYTQRLRQNNCGTHPVGQKLPNAWGLSDLHGNVWEWCADDWHDSYEGAPIDSQIWIKDIKNYEDGGGTEKALRGGSWNCYAISCRSAYRVRYDADIRNYDIGFRVVVA
ncbi:MAG: formylglycine-generating enzyme family protein, partial [Pseudanabaena sp.]